MQNETKVKNIPQAGHEVKIPWGGAFHLTSNIETI
jgi:hypothetical protein